MKRLLITSHLAIIVALAIVMSACTPDEPTINSFDDTWRILVSDGADVALYGMPDGSAQQNIWKGTGGSSTEISEFRDRVYVLPQNDPWIVVLNRETLVAIDTINMDSLGVVSDIAFANATTAYAVHPSKNLVSVIDITTNEIVRTIPVADGPHGIVALGNQIAVACSKANMVQIIDSRTNAVVESIGVPDAPYYVRASALYTVFGVVSLGSGKLDSAQQTSPQLTYINSTTRAIVGTVELSGRPSESFMQFPKGLAITPTGFAYVPVQSGLLRINSRTRAKASVVQHTDYAGIAYNAARAEVMVLRADGPVVEVWDEMVENQKSSVTLPRPPASFIGLPR